MKKMRVLFYAFTAIFAVLLSACNNPTPVEKIDLSQTSVEILPEGGVQTVTLTVPVVWAANPSATWIQVTPNQGDAGTVTLEIKADKNDTGADRSGSVLVTAGSLASVSIAVSQKAMPEEPGPDGPDDPSNSDSVNTGTQVEDWNDGGDTPYHKE